MRFCMLGAFAGTLSASLRGHYEGVLSSPRSISLTREATSRGSFMGRACIGTRPVRPRALTGVAAECIGKGIGGAVTDLGRDIVKRLCRAL